MTRTARERVRAAFEHREPDRTPIGETTLQPPTTDVVLGREVVFGWLPRQLEMLRTDGRDALIAREAIDAVDLYEALQLDLIPAHLTFTHGQPIPERLGSNLWHVGRTIYEHFPDTGVTRVRSERGQSNDLETFLRSIDELRPTRPPPETFNLIDGIRDEMARRHLDLPLYAGVYTLGVWDRQPLMEAMLLEPDAAARYFQLQAEQCMITIEACHEHGVTIFGIGGDFGANRGPIISPECYRRFIVGHLRRISDFVHHRGGWTVNASDGNLWPVIDDFLIRSGVDGYKEIDSRAGMELRRLKDRFGRRICLMGNVDCADLLCFSSPQDVRRATIQCIEDGLGNGGHILMTSNCVHAGVRPENYLAMVQAHRDYFGY